MNDSRPITRNPSRAIAATWSGRADDGHRMVRRQLRGVDAADGSRAKDDDVHRRCRKNSWLPVAPVIGDGVMPTRRESRGAGRVGDAREHRFVHRRDR